MRWLAFQGFLSENKVRFTHDVIPQRVAKSKYILEHYHNSGKGIVAYAELPKGKVTLGRIGPEVKRLVTTVAEVESVENSFHYVFSTYLHLNDVEEYIRQTSNHHNVITYGDCTKEIRKLGDILGLEVVEI